MAAAVGCGSEQAAGDGGTASSDRAQQVAAAWDGSPAAKAWRSGYHPMADVVQLPEGGLRNEAYTCAYQTQNLVWRGEFPASTPNEGRVVWKNGASLTRPLMGARQAYDSVALSPGDGEHLTVTGVRLGEMTLITSRGSASVPAWLFTLEGYASPLRRAAVLPSKLPQSPIKPAEAAAQLNPVDRLAELTGGGRTVTVWARQGSCDDGPVVDALENSGSVVLSASVEGARGGPCPDRLNLKKVTVRLDRPVGDRVLLDAHTGRPLAAGQPHMPSPSWS
ncbi:hypothetical protein [Streptomyces sp. O3]